MAGIIDVALSVWRSIEYVLVLDYVQNLVKNRHWSVLFVCLFALFLSLSLNWSRYITLRSPAPSSLSPLSCGITTYLVLIPTRQPFSPLLSEWKEPTSAKNILFYFARPVNWRRPYHDISIDGYVDQKQGESLIPYPVSLILTLILNISVPGNCELDAVLHTCKLLRLHCKA